MEEQRKTLIKRRICIPLTVEESAKGDHNVYNPTWLAEHRLDNSHPHSREGPGNWYHLYIDKTQSLTIDQQCHWSSPHPVMTRGRNVYLGYNPTFETLDKSRLSYCVDMFLPIYQRYQVWRNSDVKAEIFDTLSPEY